MTSQTSIYSSSFQKDVSFQTPSKKTILQMKSKNTQLERELKALTKAEEVDLRCQQAKELQFRTKFEKYLTTGNFETSLMKKDGFKRSFQQANLTNVKQKEHVALHKLIYTNGEVDVEKVMCLHLLSVHYPRSVSFRDKRNLELFRKRSKPNMLEASALPFYIVEIIHQVDIELRDEFKENEDVIILVNTNLEKLVISILEVLAIVSPKKLQQLKELSLSKRAIQEIMIKTKIFNLLAQVKECPVLMKIENYRCEIAQYRTEPFLTPHILSVCRIRVKDRSKKLEQIHTLIKTVITTYTEEEMNNDESWSMCHRKMCNCRKISSKLSVTSRNAISLLTEDGREFAVVTGSGCRFPTGSSLLGPSVTAIIKSSPRHHPSAEEEITGYPLGSKGTSFFKNERSKLLSSLLHKVNNSQRILIGKKAAEFTHPVAKERTKRQKMPINKLIENVFSKQSLISFASTTENEELKLLFQPCCKGGLGVGSFILEPENPKSDKLTATSFLQPGWDYEEGVVPEIMKQEESIMKTASIKQDIFTSETRTKIKHFILSDNPGFDNCKSLAK